MEEFAELRLRIDEANNQHSMDNEMIEKMNRQLSDCEGEIGLLRRRIAALEGERSRNKKTITRLRDEVKRTRMVISMKLLNPSIKHTFSGSGSGINEPYCRRKRNAILQRRDRFHEGLS